MSVRYWVLRLLPAVLALGFFVAWWAVQWPEYAYVVPVRTDIFATTPYAVAIVFGFAVASSLAPWVPLYGLGVGAGMLLLQIGLWPARFSQTGWTAYLILVLLVFELAAFTPHRWRRLMLGAVVVLGLAVGALLDLPSLSYSGQWGTINGKGWDSIEMWESWAIWSVVITVIVLLLWRLGALVYQRPTAASSDRDGDTRIDLSSTLTAREYEIFTLIGHGLTNAEIATTAHISVTTVKTHVSHILVKTGSSSRAQLIAIANGATAPVP